MDDPASTLKIARGIVRNQKIALVSPRLVAEMYEVLSVEDRQRFLAMVCPTAEAMWQTLHLLPSEEQRSFWDAIIQKVRDQIFPQMMQQSLEITRQHPDDDMATQQAALSELVQKQMMTLQVVLMENFKAQRERKADPDSIARALRIICLREEKSLSQNKIAKQEKVSASYVRLVLKEKAKWRKRAAELES